MMKFSLLKRSLFGIAATLFFLTAQAQGFDYQTLKDIERHRTTAGNDVNLTVTNTAGPLSIGAPILLFGIGLLEKNDDLKQRSIEIGVAVAATVVETYALKYIVNRPRPYITYPDLQPLELESSRSFPSGHTSAAFALATALTLNYPKWYVAVPAFAWAGATGYSRLYLGVHYPTDVLAGAILGAGTAWLTWKINQRLKKNKHKDVQKF